MNHTLTGKGRLGLALYGTAHAVVDTLCAGLLFSLWQRESVIALDAGALFLLYNLLAFASQPFLGLLVDASQRPRAAAIAGCLVTAAATLGGNAWPWLGVCLAGLGNAVFHLGAGSICLNLTPGRATAPGLFVAPGALGLFVGTALAQRGQFVAWPWVLVLGLLCAAIACQPVAKPPPHPGRFSIPAAGALGLILACIGIRSWVGFGVDLPWKSSFHLALALVLFVVLAKALGGVLADRLGWGRVAVGALVIATPLLAFGAASPGPAMVGMFLLNLTMPVTLAASANLLPGRPAFAFGLTCLALELGAWPTVCQLDWSPLFGQPWVVFAMTFGAAATLYLGLKAAFHRLPEKFPLVHE